MGERKQKDKRKAANPEKDLSLNTVLLTLALIVAVVTLIAILLGPGVTATNATFTTIVFVQTFGILALIVLIIFLWVRIDILKRMIRAS